MQNGVILRSVQPLTDQLLAVMIGTQALASCFSHMHMEKDSENHHSVRKLCQETWQAGENKTSKESRETEKRQRRQEQKKH